MALSRSGRRGEGGRTTFREALDEHLRAIRGRDLPALVATLPTDGRLTLIMADGRLVRTVDEFVALHRGWFEQSTWSLDAEVVDLHETAELGLAVLRLDYRDDPPGGPPLRQASHLTLAFARRGDRWAMVFDQNTPIRDPA